MLDPDTEFFAEFAYKNLHVTEWDDNMIKKSLGWERIGDKFLSEVDQYVGHIYRLQWVIK
jgi:hypothetical protein